MTPRRYTILIALFFVGFAVTTVVINYLVDPYLMLGVERREGLNQVKVAINEHVRMSKAYHSTFERWDTLIVGNSRVEMGLDPTHRCFTTVGARVYNLGLPGAGVREQLEYALNIIYAQPIRQVYLSVDFVDFLVREGSTSSGVPINWSTNTGRLRYAFDGSVNSEYAWTSLMDHYRALFSLDALISSVRTIALQSPGQADRDDHGFNPANDFLASVASEGPHALFAQKLDMLNTKYSHNWALRHEDGSLSEDFSVLDKFLDIAEERDVRVIMFTNPFHEQFWQVLKDRQLAGQHQEWLNIITERLQRRGRKNVEFWDFSADSSYIHETVPGAGVKRAPLKWFWEPAHYRRELGDLMLEAMIGESCGQQEFGVRLF
ncbi:hypothetical protein [Accumulibacter sp.]|uniref:hypothetical protein n=1 Tax=Accumulibacter sp. TaxID=2053492 RepID=UPI0025DDE5CC|nr:hypothetical protein [Accumulibacter sp.]MCP5230006.1 hypothetical protein [Accumulibacter sp.]